MKKTANFNSISNLLDLFPKGTTTVDLITWERNGELDLDMMTQMRETN